MAGNSFFARFVVFALILLNLGAYYVFWPTTRAPSDGTARPMAARAEPTQRTLTAVAHAEAPADVKPPPLPSAAVAEKPAPEPSPPMFTIPDVGPALPVVAEPAAKDDQQLKLESLKNAVALPPPVVPIAAQTDAAPSWALANPAVRAADVKPDNSPWTFQMDFSEGRTLLRARLHQGAEFKLHCDRVEMKAPDGAVQAVGKVAMTGPGVTASCQKLTLPLAGAQMILEGQAEVKLQENAAASWEIRGEQLTLRAASQGAATTPPLRAASGTSDPAAPGLFPLLPKTPTPAP